MNDWSVDMPEIEYDGVIVVGLGGFGSAAAYHLAARGETVLGFDPRLPGHTDGSSHGRTRMVRQAYFEDAAYVPLARRAWQLWHELEDAAGEHLLTASGVVGIGRIGDPVAIVHDTLDAGQQYGLPLDHLSANQIRAQFPAITVGDDYEAVFEADAGFVDPQLTVAAHHRLAKEHGAVFEQRVVLGVEHDPVLRVITADAVYRPRAVVMAVGPWAPELLAGLELPIRTRRKVVAHFTPLDDTQLTADTFPAFFVTHNDEEYYGFPVLDGQGLKIARHSSGEWCTPDTIDRTVHPHEVEELHAVLREFIPAGAGDVRDSYTCMYTMSTDEDFIIGALPEAPGLIVATGCSGHAFKFVPVIGEILADLATGRPPQVDPTFLSPARFTAAAASDVAPAAGRTRGFELA